MRILITGGAGFIGSTIARRFLDKGEEVVVLDNLKREGVVKNLARIPEAKFVMGDIRKDMKRCGKVDALFTVQQTLAFLLV